MLTPLDHLLFAVLAFALPALGLLYWFPRLMCAPFELLPKRRMQTYVRAIVVQWFLLAAAIALWALRGRDWAGLGFSLGRGWWALPAWAAAPAAVIAVVQQSRLVAGRPELWGKLRAQLGPLERMLPHTPGELRAFGALSITAGVCEEALYRGYMIAYLQHAMPLAAAAAVSGALFGLGHAYQGVKGVAKTGTLGLFFAALYAISGTVWPLMLVHAVVDLSSGWLAYRFVVEREPAGPPAGADSGFPAAPEPAITSPSLESEA